MVEVRRYVAEDARHAERLVESERPQLAARGLEPTWRVWVGARFSGRADGRGELMVRWEAPPKARPTLPRGLAAAERTTALELVVQLREIARLSRRALADLEREAQAPGTPGNAGPDRRRLRQLEARVREVEAKLEELERLPR